MTAVIGMGILIVAGVAVLAMLLMQRMSSVSVPIASAPDAAAAAVTLDEPPGTRMVGASPAGDRLSVVLSGGGPDRVVILDTRTGRVVGRVALAR